MVSLEVPISICIVQSLLCEEMITNHPVLLLYFAYFFISIQTCFPVTLF
jgi:hypothetical protein